MHEEAFRHLGGLPEEILCDRMKTVWLEIDERGEVVWHPAFLDFARYWGFQPRLCRPYRAQTKGQGGIISGQVRNARPKQQIVIYAHSGPWWVQAWPPYLGS